MNCQEETYALLLLSLLLKSDFQFLSNTKAGYNEKIADYFFQIMFQSINRKYNSFTILGGRAHG